jgi:hypothetical protein
VLEDAQRALAQMAEGAAGDADNEVAANAMQVSPAIMPAATSVISTGLAARDFGGVLLVCWVWAVNSFWLIGFLPVTFPSRRRLAMFLSSLVAGPTASVPDRDAGVCNLADTAAGYLRIPPCVRPASTPALRPSRSGVSGLFNASRSSTYFYAGLILLQGTGEPSPTSVMSSMSSPGLRTGRKVSRPLSSATGAPGRHSRRSRSTNSFAPTRSNAPIRSLTARRVCWWSRCPRAGTGRTPGGRASGDHCR